MIFARTGDSPYLLNHRMRPVEELCHCEYSTAGEARKLGLERHVVLVLLPVLAQVTLLRAHWTSGCEFGRLCCQLRGHLIYIRAVGTSSPRAAAIGTGITRYFDVRCADSADVCGCQRYAPQCAAGHVVRTAALEEICAPRIIRMAQRKRKAEEQGDTGACPCRRCTQVIYWVNLAPLSRAMRGWRERGEAKRKDGATLLAHAYHILPWSRLVSSVPFRGRGGLQGQV